MKISQRNYSDLPSEILLQIFKRVPRNTLIVCLHICKSWHYTAKQLLYATIVTGTKNISQLIECLDRTCAGDMVKLLQINEHMGMERVQLIRLINTCRNLQELQIINNASLFKWIQESDKITLNKLRVITPIGRSSWRLTEQNNLFCLVAHKFCSSIETLHIPCAFNHVYGNNFESTLAYLSSFVRLKNLTLLDGSMNDIIYLDHLLSTCPALETLNMQLGHPLSDDKSTASIYPALRTLDFYLTSFSVDYIQYMIDSFINMNSFTIRVNEGRVEWNRDKDTIRHFLAAEYIPFIKRLQSSCLNINTNGCSSIGDFFAEFTHLDKTARIESYFRIENSRSEQTNISIETQKNRNTMAKYTFVKDFSFSFTELPYAKHLETYGRHIASLHINSSYAVGRGIDFSFILNQCQDMEHITIDIAPAQPREYRWCSLLEMYNSTPNIFWSNDHCNNIKNDSLSKVSISGGMITTTLLNNISNYARNLKKLSLMNCTFEMDDTNTHAHVSTFDMSNLSLEEFELDTCMLYHPDRQYTQVVITSKEEGQSNFYIFDKKHFEHVSLAQFNNHCTTIKEQKDAPFVILEFVFNTLEAMRVHVGKYAQQQVIENIFFWYPEYFSYRSIK